jgi:GntR family transcriptional repressor for pyruvate dehydrogenase complex
MTSNDQELGFTARQVIRPRAQVQEQIREAILLGHFAQGEKLPAEIELAEQFGVSRPTVREALGALVSGGLIRKVPGVAGGSFVSTVTPESLAATISESMSTVLRLGALDVRELTEVRRVLEVPAARWAAVHRTEEQIAELWSIVDRQRTTTITDPDIPSYDLAFHANVGRASGNRLLGALVSALHEATRPAHFLEITPAVAKTTVRQHIAIVRALQGGRPDEAAQAMEAHLAYVLRYSSDLSGEGIS